MQVQGATVLVVDDDADIRETVMEVLSAAGYATVGAASGPAALGLLEGGLRPALVLLDLRMPGMRGEEVREAMLADPELAAIPVVFFSADARVRERSADLRVADVLEKPISLGALRAMVERFAGHTERALPGSSSRGDA